MTLTNGAERERQIFLSCGNSRLFDEAGNEYTAGLSFVGGKDSRSIVKTYTCGGASNELIPQVPTKAGLKFENVSTEAKKVTLLASFGSNFKVTFRDVEIK
jgi:tRNA(Glu) U13 pseudouridine synthase TruD